MIDHNADHTIRRTFGTGELQRVNSRAIKQARHPDKLTVGLIEYKVTINVPNSNRPWKVGVSDLTKRAGCVVVDVAGAVGSNEQLSAVVCHADRASAGYGAEQRGVVRSVDLVQLGARYHERNRAVRGE